MPRLPGASLKLIDAVHAAKNGLCIERQFALAGLTRLLLAGADEKSALSARFGFSLRDGHPAIDGELTGSVRMTCQRCMRPVDVAVADEFQVVLVSNEDATPEQFGGYEPVAVDATELDLQWLAEEQALLALPLAPMHALGRCTASDVTTEVATHAAGQQPFGNLRELLQKR